MTDNEEVPGGGLEEWNLTRFPGTTHRNAAKTLEGFDPDAPLWGEPTY